MPCIINTCQHWFNLFDEIINALFGYGSFNIKDVEMTASALKYFGYGIPALL